MRYVTLLFLTTFIACQKSAPKADAYGNFEADERIISAEATGKILTLSIEEGQELTYFTIQKFMNKHFI